jgi:hypothetical protein
MIPDRFRFLGLCAAWFTGCLSGVARAQPLAPSITVDLQGITHTIARDGLRLNSQINYADCVNDDRIDFPLQLTGRQTYTLEAWVGIGCESLLARSTVGQTQCTLLYSEPSMISNPVLEIPARDIVARYTEAQQSTGNVVTVAGLEACEDHSGFRVISSASCSSIPPLTTPLRWLSGPDCSSYSRPTRRTRYRSSVQLFAASRTLADRCTRPAFDVCARAASPLRACHVASAGSATAFSTACVKARRNSVRPTAKSAILARPAMTCDLGSANSE